jgi:hypothetical protein
MSNNKLDSENINEVTSSNYLFKRSRFIECRLIWDDCESMEESKSEIRRKSA